MRKLLFAILLGAFCLTATAQGNNRRRQRPTQREQLQQRQRQVQQQRQANQQRQRELEKQISRRMQDVEALGSEIEDHGLVIDSLKQEIDTLNIRIALLDSQLTVLQTELEERRQHYIKSVRYMYRNRNAQNQMMFVLSAQNLAQMYRRMRFMNEYTTYQRAQAEAVKQKREQVDAKLTDLNTAHANMCSLLAKGEQEQQRLEQKKAEQQTMVADLQRQQQTVKRLITQQQREEANLNAQIDRLIAEEIEKARKAEEERQRRLAEQRRREQEQQAAAAASGNSNNNRGSNRRRNNSSNRNTQTATNSVPVYSPATQDQRLTGSFASNKGRLPIPITGSYRVIRGFGAYTLAGVTLQSSSIHLQGQQGAQARCVFEGEVSKVYNPGSGYFVMVRHGRYISVYGNLSSVSVSSGQKVKTNQTLGTVGQDHVLIFRLQNWDKLLNPKQWLSRL